MKIQPINAFSNESFEDMFKQSLSGVKSFEDNMVKGIVISADNYYVTVDVGLKSEGKILLSEFKDDQGNTPVISVGDEVEVYIERYEDSDGTIILSREKAKREEVWYDLEKLCKEETPVQGFISKRVKGGFAVMVNSTLAFLPGSQLDIRPIKNINSLVGTTQTLQILKMDKKRFNIVVSRKAIIMKNGGDSSMEHQDNYEEGQVVEGVVKNITGYGAFIDLGNVDGLLHVTDISWSRISHPSEILQLGQTLQLKVIKINAENRRISLGLKQLSEDPWNQVVEKYQIGQTYTVPVTNLIDYGIFVELAKGVEGLVHISEMSWVKKDIDPKKDYKIGEEVDVKVLDVDHKKRRMNLSMKQCDSNPWAEYIAQNPEGTELPVIVKDVNDGGIIVKLTDVLDGFIRLSDIDWESKDKELLAKYKAGDSINAKIIRHDIEKDKVLLGIKQLVSDPFSSAMSDIKKGSIVKGTVIVHSDNHIEVQVKEGIVGIVKKFDLSLDRESQNIAQYPIGSEIEAIVLSVNPLNRQLALSIKSLEISEQKKNMSIGEEDNSSSLAQALSEAMSKKDS